MNINIKRDEETGELSVWLDGKTTGQVTVGEMLEHIIALLTTPVIVARRLQMKSPEVWAKPWNEQSKGEET